MDSLREGLKGLCERGGRCWFRDGEEEPEVWPLGEESGGKREVRFARIGLVFFICVVEVVY